MTRKILSYSCRSRYNTVKYKQHKNKQTWGQFCRCSYRLSKCWRSTFSHFDSRACTGTSCKWSTSSPLSRHLGHGFPVQISFERSTRHFLFTPSECPLPTIRYNVRNFDFCHRLNKTKIILKHNINWWYNLKILI